MSVGKKIISFFLAGIVFCTVLSCLFPASAISVSAGSAILIDAESGEILYSKNADKIRPMASTTKIMTAVIAIESGRLDELCVITREAVGIEGSSIYLCEGESLTLRQLVYALMLSSANDAAAAIAVNCAGSIEKFAVMMNEKAEALGLTRTHFDNPHGLDSDAHYTTAADLAKLTAYALKLADFKAIVSTYKAQIPMCGTENGRLLVNHNKLLRTYKGIVGVKTGFTKKSGRCLVSAAERNGTVLIAVTLNAPDDWNDHRTMLDHGFENYRTVELTKDISSLPFPVISGTKNEVRCAPSQKLSVLLPKDHGPIVCRTEAKRFLFAPVEKGEKVGEIIFFCDGVEIGRAELLAINTIELRRQKYTIWDNILDFFTNKGLT